MEFYTQRRSVPLGARLLPVVIGLGACAMFMIQSCTTGPFGRAQLRAINEQQEMELGTQAFVEVKRQEQAKILDRNAMIVQVVREITTKLSQAAKDPEVLATFKLTEDNFKWEVEVIQSDEANAFCLPGGKMVVYTGILPIAQTDAALAAVMGHEISHALAHHGAERMAQEHVKEMGLASVAGGLGDMSPTQRQAVMQAFGAAANIFGTLKYSKDHESEADRMGLILMAKAGFNPEEAIRFWTRMQEYAQARGAGSRPEFMSTHPSHETRIRDLTGWQSEAKMFYEKAPRPISSTPLPRINAERAFGG
jgi:predicted Zn-dependent protease